MEEKIWTVERQLTYKVWAGSEEEALAESRLLDPETELSTAWLREGESNDEA